MREGLLKGKWSDKRQNLGNSECSYLEISKMRKDLTLSWLPPEPVVTTMPSSFLHLMSFPHEES